MSGTQKSIGNMFQFDERREKLKDEKREKEREMGERKRNRG